MPDLGSVVLAHLDQHGWTVPKLSGGWREQVGPHLYVLFRTAEKGSPALVLVGKNGSRDAFGSVRAEGLDEATCEPFVASLLAFTDAVTVDNVDGELQRIAGTCRGTWKTDFGKLAWLQARALQAAGDFAPALAAYELAGSRGYELLAVQLGTAACLAGLGRGVECKALLKPLMADWKANVNDRNAFRGRIEAREALARGHAILGERKQALSWFERAHHKGEALDAVKDPDFATLHADPEFLGIVRTAIGDSSAVVKVAKLARAAKYKDVPRWGFGIAAEVDQYIRIKAANCEAARQAIVGRYTGLTPAQLQAIDIGIPMDDTLRQPSLDAMFALWDTPLGRDASGDVVGVGQGGENWALHLLDPIAAFVEPGSYVYAFDDDGRFWRALFDGKAVCHGVSERNVKASKLMEG